MAVRQACLSLSLSKARKELREYTPRPAIKRLEKVLDAIPDCAEAEFLLAVADRRAGFLARVEPHLVRAAELGWDPKAIERQRFLMQFQAGDFKRAGAYVKRLFDQGGSDDDAEEVCECMIRGYYAGLLFREARMIVKYWIDWQPENPEPYLLRAEDAVLMNNVEAEIAAYRDILRFAPRHYDTRRRLAHALIEHHDFGEAFELLLECQREKPDDGPTLIGLASCFEQQGRLDDARKTTESALRLSLEDRERADVLEVQARLASDVRDHAEAARLFEQVVELAPAEKAYVYGLVQALQRSGRANDAQKYMQEWEELKQIEGRLDELRDALLQHPDDPDLRCEVGKLELNKGGHEVLGVNWLLSTVMREPGHRAANEALAEYYRSVGQTALAERHLAAIKSYAAPSPLGPRASASEASVSP